MALSQVAVDLDFSDLRFHHEPIITSRVFIFEEMQTTRNIWNHINIAGDRVLMASDETAYPKHLADPGGSWRILGFKQGAQKAPLKKSFAVLLDPLGPDTTAAARRPSPWFHDQQRKHGMAWHGA